MPDHSPQADQFPGNSAGDEQIHKMNDMTHEQTQLVVGGDNAAMQWGETAASSGLHYATNSGGNLLVMTEGTLLAAAGGWVWAAGSFCEGIASIWDSIFG